MAHILIIDDEKDLLEVLRDKFDMHDWKVTTSSHPLEALKLIEQNTYDCILSDVVMPDMDGFEMISRIRVSDKNRTAIVILMSGHYSTREISEKAGFKISGVLEKPFKYDDFSSQYEKMSKAKDHYSKSSESHDSNDFDFIETEENN